MKKRIPAALIFVLFCIFAVVRTTWAREITDMSGRKVVVPDRLTKVFATSPPGTYLLYAINPEIIVGVNFPTMENEKKYTVRTYRSLPVIGGIVGNGRTVNQEVLLQSNPDLIVIWDWRDSSTNKIYEDMFTRMNIPWVYVRLDTLAEYPDALLFMGDLLNRKKRAAKLHQYVVDSIRKVRAAVAGIRPSDKLKVYYAEGFDGLATERDSSFHVELIPFAGGINVHKGEALDHYGMEHVSMEQVIAYNPDVILAKEKAFYDRVYGDARWKNIRAVQYRRVYLIPNTPFNWFDRPPSFMRLLGAKWLAHTLYPQRYHLDMVKETRAFYRLFLGIKLSEKEAREVLNQ